MHLRARRKFKESKKVLWVTVWFRLLRFIFLHKTSDQNTGLSLSFCVKDILDGRVRRAGKIVSATCANSKADWEALFESYSKGCWYNYPTQARFLVEFLKWKSSLEQPRLDGLPGHNICYTHWLIGPVTRETHREWSDSGDVLVGVDGTRSGEGAGVYIY